MTERLLQYIWQFQYFNRNSLQTVSGDDLVILSPGNYNRNQGPDFLDARIKLNRNTWAGNVELHVKGSDWFRHDHEMNRHYTNVILHVVWHYDEAAPAPELPTLVLSDRVSKILLRQFNAWMNENLHIPCASAIQEVKEIVWINWMQRLLVERLQRKSLVISQMLAENHFHWQETAWWLICRSFGLYVNADAFEAIAKSIPFSLLLKISSSEIQLKSLLLGQAEVIEKLPDRGIQKCFGDEYVFLKKKFGLQKTNAAVHYLRMRPSSFPHLRLLQLANLIYRKPLLYSEVFDISKDDELAALLPRPVLINAVAPLLFAFGMYHDNRSCQQRALQILCTVPAEKNGITREFRQCPLPISNAGDSQALIELKTQYCERKRCLDCAVGNAILKRSV